MKENKVLSVVYGIALFAALMGAIGLLYSSVDLLRYTTYHLDYDGVHFTKEFTDFQKPVAISLLVSSIFAIAGVVGGTGYIFSKKRVFKIIFLSCTVVAVIATLATLIAVCSISNSYIGKNYEKVDGVLLIYNSTTVYALYTTSMSALIQVLVCIFVIFAIVLFDFVKPIIEKRKNGKVENSSESSQEESQENQQENIVSEKENIITEKE